MTVLRPTDLDAAVAAEGEYRAGGTDVEERHRLGISAGPVVDLAGITGLAGIEETDDGGLRIGAMTRLVELERIGWLGSVVRGIVPGLRAVGTVGGELLQRTRCWYYRHPHARCLKRGGDDCPARGGDHLYGVVFDTGPCVWPHPSSLAPALVAAGARAEIHGGPDRLVEDLYGDGSDPSRDHLLGSAELLVAVVVPAVDRWAHVRVDPRSAASAPLVEVVAVEVAGVLRVVGGGVAPAPRRLVAVEEAMAGGADPIEAARRVAEGAAPLPGTAYKLDLLRRATEEALTGLDGDDETPRRSRRGV